MKFLKGKVWQILLAVVALVAILCITASATEFGTASFKIGSTTYAINQDDGNALYFTTNESGVATQLTGEIEEMENTYHIKAVFPKDDGETEGVPTIYLRGAYLTQSITSVSNTETLARIVVEDDANFTVTVPVEDGEDKVVNAYLNATVTWSHSNIEFCGPGKLYSTKHISAGTGNLIFKNGDVEHRTGTSTGVACLNVIFDGGRFVFESTGSFLSYWSGDARSMKVTNNAYVDLNSTEKPVFILPAGSNLTVDSGYTRLANTGVGAAEGDGNTFRGALSMKITGGTVEVIGYNWLTYSSMTVPVDLSEYPAYNAVYSNSNDLDTATMYPFEDTALMHYYKQQRQEKYFKVEPKYTTTVEGGTVSASPVVKGTEVTLTATPTVYQEFACWEVVSAPEGFTLADPTNATTTFAMPDGNVAVKAVYTPKYTTTVEGGTVSASLVVEGTEVTLTAGASSAGKEFWYWEIVSAPEGFTLADPTNATTTFAMPAGNVEVKAVYAFSATVTFNVKLNEDSPQTYTFKETDAKPLYFQTSSEGVVTEYSGENPEDNYQIKLAFVKGVPTMYLKGATIKDLEKAVVISSGSSAFVVETEAASTIEHTRDENKDNGSGGNSTRAAITFSGTLTFRGDERLTLKGANSSIYGVVANGANAHIVFDRTNVLLRTTGGRWAEANIAGKVGSVIVNGGVLNTVADSYMALWGINKMPVTVTGGAKVSIQSNSRTTYYGVDLNVDNGYVHIKSMGDANTCLMGSTVSVKENGTLIVESTTSGGAVMPTKPEVAAGLYVVMGDSKATATPEIYANAEKPNKTYIAIGKPVTVTVKDGTVKAFGIDPVVDANDSTKQSVMAIAGIDVTVTAGQAPSGKVLLEWVETASGAAFMGLNTTTATFAPAGDVSIKPQFSSRATFTLAGTAYEAYEDRFVYLKTVDGAVTAAGASSESYNIQLGFDGDTPAVVLNGAVINATGEVLRNGTDVKRYKIVVENDSVLTSAKNCIYVNRADLVIEGPKKLIINSNSGGQEYGDGAGIQLYHYDSKTEEAAKRSITFTSNANVVINTATTKYSGCIWNEPNSVSPDVYFQNGTQVEMISGSNMSYTSFVPKIADDYTDWAAVMLTDQATSLTPYTKGTSLYGHDYFKIAPGKVVTLTNATTSVLSNGGRAFNGLSITVTPTLSSGQGVAYWTSSLSQDKSYDSTFAFTMGSDAVSVSATIGAASGVKLGSTTYQVVQKGKSHYFTTDSTGTIVAGGTEDTYNIKLVYPENATTPMIYLRGAYVNQTIGSSSSAATTTMVIEKVGNYPSAVPEGVDADSYITQTISWGSYNLTIQGYTGNKANPTLAEVGTLKMATTGACVSMTSAYQLTFKHLNLDAVTQNESLPDSVAFYGGKAVVLAEASSVYSAWGWPDPAVQGNGISVDGNADVLLKTTHNAANAVSIYQSTAANVIINSGKLHIQSTTSQAIRFDYSGVFQINGGTVILQGATGNCAAYAPTAGPFVIPDLSGYKNGEGKAYYYATLGGAVYNAGDPISGNSNSVFKVVPAYEVTVTNGTTNKQIVAVGSATITLSPDADELAAGNNVAYWTSEDLDSTKYYDSTITFTMPEKSISFTGTYGAAADLKIGSTTYTAVRGGKIHYYTTTEAGAIAAGNADNYNIQYEYVDDETAVITLKDAYIKGAIAAGTNLAKNTEVVVLSTTGDAYKTNVGGTYVEADAYIDGGFTWTEKNIKFCGEGKLKSVSIFTMNNSAQLTFEDLTVEIVTSGSSINGNPGKIIFDGCVATLDSGYLAIKSDNTTTKGLVVTNNANVDITSKNIALYYAGSASAQVVVDSGVLNVRTTTDSNPTMQFGSGDVNEKIFIYGGTVEFSNSTGKAVGGYVPNVSGYQAGNAGNTYCAVVSQNVEFTGKYKYPADTRLDNYKYFRIEPAYSISVSGGSADWESWPAGKSVTLNLTANTVAGKGLQYWSSPAWGDGKTLKSYTFTMPSEPVTITASFGDVVNMYLNSGNPVMAVEGGLPRYYNITGTATTEVQSTDAYNVVFSYESDVPVLRLINVQLSAGRIHNYDNGLLKSATETTPAVEMQHLTKSQVELLDLVVELEGTNKLYGGSGLGPVSFVGNSLTFRSVNGGTLALETGFRCFKIAKPADAEEKATVVFDHSNVTANTTSWYQPGFDLYNADVIVDGGSLTVDMTATFCTIFRVNAGATVVKIKDNAVVDLNAELESSSLGGATFDLSEYVDAEGNPLYAAVASASKDAFMADPEGSIYNAGDSVSGKGYFRIEPKLVQVQIVWGAMSFTYDGAAWNTDTMTWEGTWTPVEGETETEAGNMKANQINVENVGTETVNVSFEFRQESTFTYATVTGAFVDGNDAAIVGACKLVRTAETDAFLKLNSAAVASGGWDNTVTLGTIVVTIDALTPSQGSEA